MDCADCKRSLPDSFYNLSRTCSKIFLSNITYLLLFIIASIIVLTQSEVIGAVIFVLLISAILVLCDDLIATTLPFLLLCVFVTRCYDSFDTFIKFIPIAVPALFSIFFHFIVFKRKLVIGNTFNGLIAVSISLVTGGIGYISTSDYLKPSSLFYITFLGIAMVVFYLLFKSHIVTIKNYDIKKKLISILYVTGFLACVVSFYIDYLSKTGYQSEHYIWQPGNNLSTFLLFALPCPFYFARKNILHILSAFVFYGGIILSRSRGGILMGAILLFICFITYAISDRKHRIIYIITLLLLISLFFVFTDNILGYFSDKSFSYFFDFDDPRIQMMKRGLKGFFEYPIFGHGLGHTGNTDIYNPVKGAMEWYHMIIPQIIAGLGLVGILAYGYQFYLRLKTTFNYVKSNSGKKRFAAITLFMSYVGVLLMSQVNPGLFCPLPYSLLAVMIFATIDSETKTINLKQK